MIELAATWPVWAQVATLFVVGFLSTVGVIHIVCDWIVHPGD